MENQAWRDAQTRKRSELVAALNVNALGKKSRDQSQLSDLRDIESLAQVESFEVFEATLDSICTRYTERGIYKLLVDKLYPWFDHIKSFTNAISSSTQVNSYASLCWGALLIVIQVGYPKILPTESCLICYISNPHALLVEPADILPKVWLHVCRIASVHHGAAGRFVRSNASFLGALGPIPFERKATICIAGHL